MRFSWLLLLLWASCIAHVAPSPQPPPLAPAAASTSRPPANLSPPPVISIPAFNPSKSLFTEAEIQAHQKNIDLIVTTASNCLDETYVDHLKFYEERKVSKYYGSRQRGYSSLKGRIRALRSYGYSAQESAVIAQQQTPISCIGLTLRCLEKGFRAAGAETTWTKIYDQLKIHAKFDGTELQKMLRLLGWKILYWNPDPSQNKVWDDNDQALNPVQPGRKWMAVWGKHAYHYGRVMKEKTYYHVPIDDSTTLVGFKTAVPDSFTKIPFFIGTAHSGYHVFPGFFGKVIEGHSMRALNARSNLEVSMFNPLAPSGGPRWTKSEKYRSGIIAIPPSHLEPATGSLDTR